MDIPDEFVPRVMAALEHIAAYMKATDRDQQPYQEVLDFMKRKAPGKEESAPVLRKKRA